MTLTLVLLFRIVTAVWAAFYSARRLVQPIRDLAAGTAAVAEGDYETSLPVQSNDDIGFLVRSCVSEYPPMNLHNLCRHNVSGVGRP